LDFKHNKLGINKTNRCLLYYTSSILLFFVISCQNFKEQRGQEIVARVNNSYLYKDDIKGIVPKNTTKQDSVNIVQAYIKNWATRQLFIDKSKLNLTAKELEEFDDLVEDYKNTLYVNAYKNAVINKAIDLEVSPQDLEEYYNQNLKNFNLNEELVKLRYLHLPSNYSESNATKRQFNRFKEEDVEELTKKKLMYLSYSFNDSTWVKLDQVYGKMPFLKEKDLAKLLKKGNEIEFKDSIGLYLIKVNDILKPKQIAPLEYMKPTIRQIILNKRKLELIKNIEKEITRDAVENKQFEIYE